MIFFSIFEVKRASSATLEIKTRAVQLRSGESDTSVKGHAEQVVLTATRRMIVVFPTRTAEAAWVHQCVQL